MDKKDYYYYDLPFWQDLTRLGEAMQYAFNSEPKSDYDKKNHEFWVKEVMAKATEEVRKQIEEFKQQNAELLAESPILAGLLDTYIAASQTKDPAKLKEIYDSFQQTQQNLPFAENKEAYVDAGCSFTGGFAQEGQTTVLFPISLYGGYDPTRQRDDDHRGGYLYPAHSIGDEEILKLAESRPVLVEKSKVFKGAYEAAAAKQGPANA